MLHPVSAETGEALDKLRQWLDDFQLLDDAHGRAWLEAAVSDDPQRIQDWILNTLDDAIFEFAFDPDLERTSNGVSLQPGAPAKPGTSADPHPND